MKHPEYQKLEQTLWNSLRLGDRTAFELLYQHHHQALYNYGCKLNGDTSAVEDAIQDVFVDLWRLRTTLTDTIISVRFYLLRILRRKLHKNTRLRSEQPDTAEVNCQDETIEELIMLSESETALRHRINSLLQTLPPRQLEAITLRFYEGLPIREIAVLMNVHEKSVRNFLYKGLCQLKQHKRQLLVMSYEL